MVGGSFTINTHAMVPDTRSGRKQPKNYPCSPPTWIRAFHPESIIGFTSENMKIKTRPEEQPIDTAVPDIAEDDGRYSGGSHRWFSPWYVIQVPLLLKPYPTATGDKRSVEAVPEANFATFLKSNVPSSVRRRSELDS